MTDDATYRAFHTHRPDEVSVREADDLETDGMMEIRLPIASTGEVRNEGDDPLSGAELRGMAQQVDSLTRGVFPEHGMSDMVDGGMGAAYSQFEKLGYWADADIERDGSDDDEDLLYATARMPDPETLPAATGDYRQALAILKEQALRGIPIAASIGWRDDQNAPGGVDLTEASIVGIGADPRTNTGGGEALIARAAVEAGAEPRNLVAAVQRAVGDDDWSADLRIFRVVAPEDREDEFDDPVLGVGVSFPESGVYVDWHTSAFPDELDEPHVSEYGSVSDLEKATGNDIVDMTPPPGARSMRPLGPPEDPDRFETFEECVDALAEDPDLSREDAEEICGAWEAAKDDRDTEDSETHDMTDDDTDTEQTDDEQTQADDGEDTETRAEEECPECETAVRDGANYCHECGADLREDDEDEDDEEEQADEEEDDDEDDEDEDRAADDDREATDADRAIEERLDDLERDLQAVRNGEVELNIDPSDIADDLPGEDADGETRDEQPDDDGPTAREEWLDGIK